MKLGIIGTGNVGNAIALAAVTRGSAREIVLVNRTSKTAEAVATDLRYGTPLSPKVDIRHGDYDALAGAGVVVTVIRYNQDFEFASLKRQVTGAQFLDFSIERAKHFKNIAGHVLGVVC